MDFDFFPGVLDFDLTQPKGAHGDSTDPTLIELELRLTSLEVDVLRQNVVEGSLDYVNHLLKSVSELQMHLVSISNQSMLPVESFYRLDSAIIRCLCMKEQLAVFLGELKMRLTGAPFTYDAQSVFICQPHEQVIKRAKGPRTDKSVGKSRVLLELKLASDTLIQIEPLVDSVSVTLSLLEEKAGNPPIIFPEVEECHWTPETSIMTISVFFTEGTRLMPATLNVSMTVLLSGALVGVSALAKTVRSANGKRLVIVTNLGQWCMGAAKLIKSRLFMDSTQESVPWEAVSNAITEVFARATAGQSTTYSRARLVSDVGDPARPLSVDHLACIHKQKFLGKATVGKADFSTFWEWFGPICVLFKRDPLLRSLWVKYLIYGFVSREMCAKILARWPPGTFLIRHSESSLEGLFAIAYVDAAGDVKHYKIDRKHLEPPSGNLADFVCSKHILTNVVVAVKLVDGVEMTHVLDKKVAFAEFTTETTQSSDDEYTSFIY